MAQALSDDVLLHIMASTGIDTFFQFRLTSRAVRDLITTHIRGLTRAVAKSTFPRQTRFQLPRNAGPALRTEKQSLRWLKDLRYHQLAAIMLEWSSKDSFSAEDEVADDLCARIAEGWKGLDGMARIFREVDALPLEQLSTRECSPLQRIDPVVAYEATGLALRRELETCHRRLEYVAGLSIPALKGLDWLKGNLWCEVFGFHDDPKCSQSGYRPGGPGADSWVFAHAARLGARPFWETWWCSSPEDPGAHPSRSGLRALMEAAWTAQDKDTRTLERQGIEVINYKTSHVREIIGMQIAKARIPNTTDYVELV